MHACIGISLLDHKLLEYRDQIYNSLNGDYVKAFDCVGHNKLWKIPKEMGIPDHLSLSAEKPVCGSTSNS